MGQVLLLWAVTLPCWSTTFSDHSSHIGNYRKKLWLELMFESKEQPWRNFIVLSFHKANQINSSLSLMIYINMSFVYIPLKKNVPQARKGPYLGSLLSKSGNESAVLKLHRQTNQVLQQNMVCNSSSACLYCKKHHEPKLWSKTNPWIFQ